MTASEKVQEGDSLRQQGNPESAVKAYQAAIQFDPQCVDAYQRLAEVLQELGSLDQAAAVYQQAIAVHPDSINSVPSSSHPVEPSPMLHHPDTGDNAPLSGTDSESTLSLEPSNQESEEKADQVSLTSTTDEPSNQQLDQFQTLIDQREWAEAVALGSRLVQQDPSAIVYKLLGTALQQQGQREDAFDAYQHALALEPNWAEVWANLGSLEAQQQQWQKATECYERAIALKPDFAGAYRNLARVWQRLEQTERSADCWYQAMMIDPDAGSATDYLNLGKEFLTRNQTERAIDCFRMATRNDPTLVAAYEQLSSALKQQQSLAEETQTSTETVSPVSVFNPPIQEEDVALSDEEKLELARVRLQECLNNQDWQGIIPYCHYILEPEPDSETYRILGNALLQLGRLESAIAAYEKALEYQPDSAETYANLGAVYVQQQQWTTAVQHFKQAIALKPDFAGAYRNLARAWQALDKTESAMECWYQALRLEPERLSAEKLLSFGDRFLLWNQPERAVECYQLAVQQDPSLLSAHQKLADLLVDMERWQEAVDHYQVLLRRGRGSRLAQSSSALAQATRSPLTKLMDTIQTTDDSDPDALYQMVDLLKKTAEECFAQAVINYREQGNIAQEKEDWATATQAYERVVELDGTLAIDWGNLGTLYARQEQWDQAIQSYERAIAIEKRASFYWNLAQVFGKLERTEDATYAYHQALILEPERATPEQHCSLGNIFAAQENLDDAIACYQRSLVLDPEHAHAIFLWASTLAKQGNTAAALNHYRRATAIQPDNSQYWHNLADALVMSEQWTEAVSAYKQAIALKPDFSWSHNNLGDTLMKLEHYADAVSCYQQAIALNPDFHWSYYNLGEALVHLQEWEGAIASYQQAIELKPDLDWITHRIGALRFLQGMDHLEAHDIASALERFQEVEQVANIESMPLPWFSPNSSLWTQEWASWISILERMKPIDRPWPRITIVTPSLNQGLYIEETILSVIRQQYPNLEYIVVDGGSTDGTRAILSHYRPYLTDLIIEPDKGQSEAINKGFKRATGDLFIWLNSDDRLMPGALHMAALTYLQRPCDVIAGMCLVHKNRQVQMIRKPKARQVDFTVDSLADVSGRWADGYFFYQPEVFFSRSIWDRIGGNVNEELHYAMDHDLWMRCAQVGAKLEVVDYPFALFRKHDQQKTANRSAATKEQLKIAGHYRELSLVDKPNTQKPIDRDLNAETGLVDVYRQENELLLLQLHQVQEELETYFLKTKEQEQLLQKLKTKHGGQHSSNGFGTK